MIRYLLVNVKAPNFYTLTLILQIVHVFFQSSDISCESIFCCCFLCDERGTSTNYIET